MSTYLERSLSLRQSGHALVAPHPGEFEPVRCDNCNDIIEGQEPVEVAGKEWFMKASFYDANEIPLQANIGQCQKRVLLRFLDRNGYEEVEVPAAICAAPQYAKHEYDWKQFPLRPREHTLYFCGNGFFPAIANPVTCTMEQLRALQKINTSVFFRGVYYDKDLFDEIVHTSDIWIRWGGKEQRGLRRLFQRMASSFTGGRADRFRRWMPKTRKDDPHAAYKTPHINQDSLNPAMAEKMARDRVLQNMV